MADWSIKEQPYTEDHVCLRHFTELINVGVKKKYETESALLKTKIGMHIYEAQCTRIDHYYHYTTALEWKTNIESADETCVLMQETC